MNIIEWGESYSVGNEVIDNQHKRIFSMINRLYDIQDPQKQSQQITDILNEMKDYAQYHFTFEEKVLSECNYPELVFHKNTHFGFIEKVNQLCSRHALGEFMLPDNIINYLYDWLTSHILDCDKRYMPFIKEKQAETDYMKF